MKNLSLMPFIYSLPVNRDLLVMRVMWGHYSLCRLRESRVAELMENMQTYIDDALFSLLQYIFTCFLATSLLRFPFLAHLLPPPCSLTITSLL